MDVKSYVTILRQTVTWPRWFMMLLIMAAILPVAAQEKGVEVELYEMTISAPPNWQLGYRERDSVQLHIPLPEPRIEGPGTEDNPKPTHVLHSLVGMLIMIEHRRDHEEAIRRLAEIASEQPEPPELLLIGGWPALERTYRALLPQTGDETKWDWGLEANFITTAVAVDTRVIRYDTMMAPDAPQELLAEVLAIARETKMPQGPESDSRDELKIIPKLWKLPSSGPKSPPRYDDDLGLPGLPAGGPGDIAGVAVNVHTGVGEVEVATNDGQNVVVAANSGYSFSSDFGNTYTFGGATPCNQVVCDGDPSLAVGASGNIYYAWIGGPSFSNLGNGVSQSTDNGQTYTFQGMAATCPGITSCSVADQEHIAADRANAAAGGGDLLYNVWRDFGTPFTLRISCSSDSGVNWTAGAAIGAIKDAVGAAGGPSTGASRRKRRQHFSGLVVEFHAVLGLFRTGGPHAIVAEHKLQITGLVRPSKFAVLGRGDDHLRSLRSGKKQKVLATFHVAGRGVSGDVVLCFLVVSDRIE